MKKTTVPILCIMLLAACGHKGALYLPNEDPPPTVTTPSADQEADDGA